MLLTNKSLALAPFLIGLLLGFSIRIAHGQENIQHQIPPSLVECYNTTFFQNRDNRLPSNLETFITLIEKVENAPNYQYDIRQLSVALLHRFRQDGIELAAGVPQYPGVIPYAPTGFQFPKFRILLSRLIPGNAFNFPNNSLSREERCSMHFMLSSSFDLRVRGNENQVCNQLSTFRSQRPRRSLDGRNNFMGDVEILEEFKQRSEQKHSSVRMANGKALNDWTWLNMGQQNINTQISQCPVENGVVRTPWGTVAIGNVIAGIAAGLQQQTVQLKTLLALSSRPGTYNAQQLATFNVDNRYAATLAGDLAETTLIQVPTSNSGNASVGATGGWNSTVMPKWYFLTQNTNLEMTDAEIRGDTDGLILALNVAAWYSQNPSMKLSQLLRMYYSTNGVLNSGIMACQRQSNFQTMINQNTLISQTAGFAQVLDREMTLRVTLTPTIIAQFAAVSTQALANYVPNYMNAVSCPVGTQLNSVANSTTVMTNIYVYLDTSWQYTQIVDYVNYVLERLNINPYASSVTMLSANNCTIMVNYTNYISDVYRQWNITTHSLYTPGFSLPSILQSIGNLTQTYMNGQQANNSAGGRSLVALLIPNNAGVSASDSNYAIPQVKYLSEQVPDLRFTYFGGGSIQRFTQYVKNATTDLYPLTFGSSYYTAAEPVVAHIKSLQRRIINPRCGSTWYANTWGTNTMTQYAYPGLTNFYRIVPNYFFGNGNNRYITVTTSNYQQLTVCSSRYIQNPLLNTTTGTTSNDPSCVSITSNPYTYDLSQACNGYSTINQCPPIYISVQAAVSSGQTTYCTNNACQSPNQISYTISATNLGCWSGVAHVTASFGLIIVAYMLSQLFQ